MPARKLPLLTPAEAYGPDIERFRQPAQSLVSWWDKQSQWWQFRGLLKTSRGRPLGFQLSFFDRHTQNDFIGAIPARWITARSFAAHFSITDPMNGEIPNTFRYWQQGGLFSNASGFAAEDRFHVELGGWYAFRREDGSVSLFANGDGDSVHLELHEQKPLTYHGQSGYAEKDVGASFYCSLPRMKATGRVLLDGKLEDVEGTVWMDHEKLTLKENPFHVNWDRLVLQFANGADLMLFRRGESFQSGTWLAADGTVKHLIASDIQVENNEYWISPETGARYPIKRSIRIEPLSLELQVKPALVAQELDTTRTVFACHWNGLVAAQGQLKNQEVEARGFMELLGYDPRPRAKVLEFLTKG